MKFIDEVGITIRSGKGGPGCISFRREAMTPRGGPDGGDGGRGGSVIFQVDNNQNSLIDFRVQKVYAAQNGEAGRGRNQSGAAGLDLILKVPPGTLIKSSSGELLYDLAEINQITVLTGGRGGKGNAFFKTSVNQAPEKAQPGEDGSELEVFLELKLIADIGIIGLPNAGKSTFISRVSAAKPKIADYPFTTLTPHLGVVKYNQDSSFVIADIPGLIKGAHTGAGLGIQFLKHVERTRVFLHLVDASALDPNEIITNYNDIQHELKMYDHLNKDKDGFFPLSERQQLIAITKTDLLSDDDVNDRVALVKKLTKQNVTAVSAATGKNVKSLLDQLALIVLNQNTKKDLL